MSSSFKIVALLHPLSLIIALFFCYPHVISKPKWGQYDIRRDYQRIKETTIGQQL